MHIIAKGLIIALIFTTSALQAQFSVSIQVDHNISCYGGNNGSLTAVVTPAGAYTFSWSNGGTTATITDLMADAYVVTVQDAAGGTVIATAILSEPAELILASVTELPLHVNPTGSVDIETSGGTAPYSFQWVNSSSIPISNSEDLIDAPAGIYTQTATDANGCTAVFSPVELIQTSGIQDLLGTTIRVFPNPVSKDLVLEIPTGGSVQMQVFNAMGQIVESTQVTGGQSTVSVHSWPAGVYSLVFPELSRTVKVVVVK